MGRAKEQFRRMCRVGRDKERWRWKKRDVAGWGEMGRMQRDLERCRGIERNGESRRGMWRNLGNSER